MAKAVRNSQALRPAYVNISFFTRGGTKNPPRVVPLGPFFRRPDGCRDMAAEYRINGIIGVAKGLGY